ncbi:hypothetical protein AA0111_g5980 [Alternaria arborescens]|uniref:hypothetical protein n=1 Tax=Alternaria arborescens TaxID=156630 RepID=UPI001074FCEE|nr:hypothetical protein AA0111_g5980 [Alternaria arborescens]RYO29550.1 hypothetical protein AA0111_g5980 [Alternaria arborescens]
METPVSPALTMPSIRPHSSAINNMEHSSLADLHSSITLHVVSVLKTHALLCEFYSLLWQSVRPVQCSSEMSHRREIRANPTGPGPRTAARQYGPPAPEPPAAPPIIILSQSGKAQAPHFQVPDPADQQVQPRPPTSSLSLEASPDELEATETSCPPDKPEPEPHPAPPVIILRDETLSSSPPASAPPTYPATTHTPPTMGSKVSKVKEQASNGKLQPSQERLDKEEMKEPDNYYTHRSKSMRRKAGKTGASSGAGGAQGGTAGGAGGAGIA